MIAPLTKYRCGLSRAIAPSRRGVRRRPTRPPDTLGGTEARARRLMPRRDGHNFFAD